MLSYSYRFCQQVAYCIDDQWAMFVLINSWCLNQGPPRPNKIFGPPHRYLMSRLSLQEIVYLWRHVLSTAPPFLLWRSNLEILFAPLHRSSPFIGGLRCQALQMEHGPHYSRKSPKSSLYCEMSMDRPLKSIDWSTFFLRNTAPTQCHGSGHNWYAVSYGDNKV
jgi:hypothetical protein